MKVMKKIIFSILAACACAGQSRAQDTWKHFRGMCDASALEMLDEDLFVAANDEDNILRVYSRSRPGLPEQSLDFSSFFGLKKASKEIDLEGAARIGDVIYWISSHGADKKGKYQASRHRFFATRVVSTNGSHRLEPMGELYSHLVRDLVKVPELAPYRLSTASRRPPKAQGALNIEGLAPTPDKHLLIGFRNPIPGGRALIVPLLNPEEVIEGNTARFGKHHSIDLKGLGIRSMTPHENGYLIVAGSYDSEGTSQLYHWDGKSSGAKLLTPRGLPGNPEGITIVPRAGGNILFVLSDDGTLEMDGKECKKLKDASLKTFRSYDVSL
jgi:hypothetical protein